MKKLFQKLSFVAVAASVAFLYSCGGDEEFAIPVISFSPASGEAVEAGSTIELTVTVTAEGGFNVLRALGDQTTEYPRGAANVSMNDDNTQAEVTINIPVPTTVGDYYIDFEAVDDQDQVATNTFEFSVTSPAVVSHTQTLLGGQLNSTTGSFYNAVDDMVYGYADFRDNNSANTDFLFFYGNTNMYTIASIVDADASVAFDAAIGDGSLSASTIQTRNESLFKPLPNMTAAEFDAIANEAALLNAYGEVAAADTKVNGLAAGNVFAFVLDSDRGSKVGLVKVVETAGTSGTDRSITIEVKIQAD